MWSQGAFQDTDVTALFMAEVAQTSFQSDIFSLKWQTCPLGERHVYGF